MTDTPNHRDRLPSDRESLTHKFCVKGQQGEPDTEVYMIVGFYPDGRIGELFVTVALDGTAFGALLDQWAIAVSIAIQHGASVESIARKFAYQNFSPMGWTTSKHEQLRSVRSVVDYIARVLWLVHSNGVQAFREWTPDKPQLNFPALS